MWFFHHELYHLAKKSKLFIDTKTFVDAAFVCTPHEILSHYQRIKNHPHVNLKEWLQGYLDPFSCKKNRLSKNCSSMEEYVTKTWPFLFRHRNKAAVFDSIIPLDQPYVAPGDRFNEMYYWDTYFTLLGLTRRGDTTVLEQHIDHCNALLHYYGFIPNGNRVYYLSRSHPPFFSLLLQLLWQCEEKQKALRYLPSLEKEYRFWMDGHWQLSTQHRAEKRVVYIDEGLFLNRYWDSSDCCREEMYEHDALLCQSLPFEKRRPFCRNLRAACESGWDFSSRWLKSNHSFCSICTTDILPIDLNCLLYHLEKTLSQFAAAFNDQEKAEKYQKAASQRSMLIHRLFWNQKKGFFFDYSISENRQREGWSLAALFPLFVQLCDQKKANCVAEQIRKRFLYPGGVVTSLCESNQQWDFPNGWAPLQWITIVGLLHYNHCQLAKECSHRWLTLVKSIFQETHCLFEKYNVVDSSVKAMSNDYDNQIGFGWTNGVVTALQVLFNGSRKNILLPVEAL